MEPLGPLGQPSSVSNSGTSSPRPSVSETGDADAADSDRGSTDSEEERLQLKKRLGPVHTVDVSSLAEPSL